MRTLIRGGRVVDPSQGLDGFVDLLIEDGEVARLGERLKIAKPDCLVMHPGPMNRGVEIASDVADGDRSVILEQVTNGVAVRMAVLYLCSGAGEAA